MITPIQITQTSFQTELTQESLSETDAKSSDKIAD